MSQSSAFAKFTRFCGFTLAAALVLFALTVSLIRGLLPQLDEVRQDLVHMLEADYGIHLEVGRLEAQWQAFGPALTVTDLQLPEQDKLPLALDVKQVQVKLDFWESLMTLSPQVEDVLFDGVAVKLDIDRLKSLSSGGGDTNLDWLYRLLLEQLQRFSIAGLSLDLISAKHDYRPIYLKDLHWLNSGASHQGQGALYLDADASDKELLTLRVDLNGDGNRPDTLKGQAYLAARALDLGEWASRRPNPYNPKATLPLEGVVNFEAWLDLGNRTITSGMMAFAPSYLEWQLNKEVQRLTVLGGEINWVPSARGWQMYTHDLSLQTNGDNWPDPQLSLTRKDDAFYLESQPLLAQRLLPLLPLVPGVTLDELYQWQAMAPHGEIGPLALYWPMGQQAVAKVDIKQLGWKPAQGIPGIESLTATLGWQNEQLYFQLPKQQLITDFDGEFAKPLSFELDELKGQFNSSSKTLMLPGLVLDNPDIRLAADTRLEFADKPLLALSADLQIKNAAHADRYYPVEAMGQDLVDYLADALKKGNSPDAKVVWNGELSGFPYKDNSGVFQAGFHLNDAEFKFQPDWPGVTDLSLYALFENLRMDLWLKQGKLLDVDAKGAHVFIPNMGDKVVLGVKADLNTQADNGVAVINQSPLESVSSTLDVVQLSGDIGVKLDLTIPLYDGGEEAILGWVTLKDNPLFISKPGIQLEKVKGVVAFNNDRVSAPELQALLYDQPLQLDFTTESRGDEYALDLNLAGQWQLDALPQVLDNPLSNNYKGSADWDGKLTMIFDQTGYRLQAKVDSDLKDVELMLPAPFAKPADDKASLSAELIGDNKETNLSVKLGDKAEFWGSFDAASGSGFAYYDLLLGRLFRPGDQLRRQGGHIQLALDSASMDEWMPVINSFLPEQPAVPATEVNLSGSTQVPVKPSEPVTYRPEVAGESVAIAEQTAPIQTVQTDKTPETALTESSESTDVAGNESRPLFPSLQAITGEVTSLSLLGQTLQQVKLDAAPTANAWRIKGESPQFIGHVDLYPDWHNQGLKLVASRLYLSAFEDKSETGEQSEPLGATQLPPIAADVDDFRYDNKPLGHLVLQGTPSAEGYEIQTLSLSSADATLAAKGNWFHINGQNLTDLSLTLKASKFDALTGRLGIDPGVKDASLDMTANLNWQGAPYNFSVASLNGDVKFDLGKGHLSQISDKGARIFSLFSLDSLLRKLSLDFSDVFGKGLYFNSFGGTLQIDNGVIKTTDTEMEAVAGNMKVRGYTDLRTESLNYDISFVPQLASSVPTVVLLSTSAWTLGIGAFALTKVLEPVIEVISEIRFRLTGTMADPKLEELERKSKEIEIPESVLPKQQVTEQPTEEGTPQGKQAAQPDTGDKPVEPKTQNETEPVESGGDTTVKLLHFPVKGKVQGVSNANQCAAVPEQPGCKGQSQAARIAA
ncbi:TIGR02099 family protein [Shewanella corallii]|uniref:TIGR02099 family protein n=1 Tax=Shewanella corallii TaxID=560080 RepID=A0ABT0N1G3_9GAMM|nr:TIGR02099 family protein [Shewanella corallii]